MWIKKENDVEVSKELEYEDTSIQKTNAYSAKITECRLANSKTAGSKSVSLVVGVETEDGETNRTYFTIIGKDGETFFTTQYKGKPIKKQHFGLSIANTLFQIVLGKEIFDVEPTEVEYEVFDKEEKEMVKEKGDGFPDLIGAEVGICLQRYKEIAGSDSKEYGTIEHFFDVETGLFANEDVAEGAKTKLDKWLGSMKEVKVVEKEAQNKSAFGKKKDDGGEDKPKSKWGSR